MYCYKCGNPMISGTRCLICDFDDRANLLDVALSKQNPKICPRCHNVNPDFSNFCGECGTRLAFRDNSKGTIYLLIWLGLGVLISLVTCIVQCNR